MAAVPESNDAISVTGELVNMEEPSTSTGIVSSENSTLANRPRLMPASEVRKMWNLFKIIRFLGNREDCIKFAEEHNLILKEKICWKHKKPMAINLTCNKTVGAFNCSQGDCRQKGRISRACNTWFENVKKKCHMFSFSCTALPIIIGPMK